MTVSINGTSGVVFNDASTQNTAATGFGFKNRIINGAMVISQRNAGASVTNDAADLKFAVDRTNIYGAVSSKFTAQQTPSTTETGFATRVGAGFTNYLAITSSSAYTVGAAENFWVQQRIEGFNVADLGWGTATAATVTLSFWVHSSLTGTFGGAFQNSASNRSYPFTYTISAANTWEQKTVTVAGDTSGTWLTTNGVGIKVTWGLGVGSTYSGTAGAWAGSNFNSATGATSVVGTNGATFYITGVQLEKGSTATSFDYRPYGTELRLCQRYYYRETSVGIASTFAIGFNDSTTSAVGTTFFPVTMRTAPSALEQTGTAGDYRVRNTAATSTTCSAVPVIAVVGTTPYSVVTSFTVASGLTAGQGAFLQAVNATAYLAWSAEL